VSTPISDASSQVADAESDALILGLGNLLLSDEGVGIHVLRHLEQGCDFTPGVELVDGGTTGLDLLDLFRKHQDILLIDALFVPDAAPGDIHILHNDAILAALSKKISMHHLGISDVLALAQLLDYRPRNLVLIGVVPGNLELGTELSSPVAQRLLEILDRIRDILSDWGVRMQDSAAGRTITAAPTGAALFKSPSSNLIEP
jgi:hydrogenase maturation protease